MIKWGLSNFLTTITGTDNLLYREAWGAWDAKKAPREGDKSTVPGVVLKASTQSNLIWFNKSRKALECEAVQSINNQWWSFLSAKRIRRQDSRKRSWYKQPIWEAPMHFSLSCLLSTCCEETFCLLPHTISFSRAAVNGVHYLFRGRKSLLRWQETENQATITGKGRRPRKPVTLTACPWFPSSDRACFWKIFPVYSDCFRATIKQD